MEETIDPKQPTKGELFKTKTGYSKSMKRMMTKYNCKTPDEYRKIRRKNQRDRR
jgi:hypothetical protein